MFIRVCPDSFKVPSHGFLTFTTTFLVSFETAFEYFKCKYKTQAKGECITAVLLIKLFSSK